jgi:hypothetical protein
VHKRNFKPIFKRGRIAGDATRLEIGEYGVSYFAGGECCFVFGRVFADDDGAWLPCPGAVVRPLSWRLGAPVFGCRRARDG